ncbi:hypothetical protein BURMUCF2_A0269 [Burkholderia multivorans CF2]|nr:hypothetical protein BURMUCF2_A0269 [Burkholderia multivorans CF2]
MRARAVRAVSTLRVATACWCGIRDARGRRERGRSSSP